MIKKIAHLSDIHLRKSPLRSDEYDQVFTRLYKSLIIEKPDRIVIVGDLVNDYLDLQSEQLIMANNLLHNLCKIAPVRVVRGNHDCKKKNLKRVDSVSAIVKTLGDADIKYYDNTGVYVDDNIVWAVWHHGDLKNNPWMTKEGKLLNANRSDSGKIHIDLFHETVNGCKSDSGLEMTSGSYNKISEFIGDYSFFGHIHKMQYLDKKKTKAFCGSLIAQKFDEGDDEFHGYLIWDVINSKVTELPIHNDYSFKNVVVSQYVDFDDLCFDIDNPTQFMRVRFIWKTLPQSRTKENVRKITEYMTSKYVGIVISHKNEFIENEQIDVKDTVTLSNVTDKSVQQQIFREYLTKIGVDGCVIDDVIALDDEITRGIDVVDDVSIEWNVLKFGGKNFMSYEELDVDWSDKDGLFQIGGANTAGKTTILKILSYLLYGKTLETESRIKYGDIRFINNRNNANFCDAYLIFEANGEYFGIKRKTEINRNKSGEILNVPTTLNYYQLQSPDDELTVDNSIDCFDEIRRTATQSKINSIIGTYDNFMRVVMTTSDTLNTILSNDMATFIDSLLFDSGLDIFDKKLDAHKSYQKELNKKTRINCNVTTVTSENVKLEDEINILTDDVYNIENIIIPQITSKINTNTLGVADLNKKQYKIDEDIYKLNVDGTYLDIKNNTDLIETYRTREKYLNNNIVALKSVYDVDELNRLNQLKDEHKTHVYELNLKIKTHEQNIRNFDHKIEIINGDIFRLKESGLKIKNEIISIGKSKNCPTCGQLMSIDHRIHIDELITKMKIEMYDYVDKINIKNDVDRVDVKTKIELENNSIKLIETEIKTCGEDMENVLIKIGEITNDMNDVEKRRLLQNELDLIPINIQNIELKTSLLQSKITNFTNSILQIEENKRTELQINNLNVEISTLNNKMSLEKQNIYAKNFDIIGKKTKIVTNQQLVSDFTEQEYLDRISLLYKSCVHRDGIPRQILINYVIPKINLTLEKILSIAQFKIWLDLDDLRPKLVYHTRPTAIIDCISSSGKERTFSSVVLKFALNQINVKAKPTMFLLDEVMGKLDDDSVEEFIEILNIIKIYMRKILIVEYMREIEPDYLFTATSDSNGISSLILE